MGGRGDPAFGNQGMANRNVGCQNMLPGCSYCLLNVQHVTKVLDAENDRLTDLEKKLILRIILEHTV